MTLRAIRSLPATCLVALLAFSGASATAQDGSGAPPGSEEGAGAATDAAAAEAAEQAALDVVAIIDGAVNKRDPTPIRPVFGTLDEHWSRLSPKTAKRVTKSISGMFTKLKPRETRDMDTLGDQAKGGRFGSDEDGGEAVVDTQRQDVLDCYHAAIGLLYDKPEGPAVLLPALKLEHVKNWPEVQVLVLEGLGYRSEPALAKEFEAYVRDANTDVASAAVRALGQLRDQPIEVRRRAVKVIVDAFSAAQKASDKEGAKAGEDDERPARRYLAYITVAFREALTALTRQSFDKPPEWQQWFDAHGKNADW